MPTAARRRTGVYDFGPDHFRTPLRVLLAALAREADLSVLGRVLTGQLLTGLLVTRLRLTQLLDDHPEVLEEKIDRPIVILGLPRTGTSHLHNLLAQDPALRSLPYWESLEPIPEPPWRRSAAGADPRRRRCEQALRFQHWVMPLFPAMHEMTADACHEEIQLLAVDFSTMLFEASYRLPSYRDWYHSPTRPDTPWRPTRRSTGPGATAASWTVSTIFASTPTSAGRRCASTRSASASRTNWRRPSDRLVADEAGRALRIPPRHLGCPSICAVVARQGWSRRVTEFLDTSVATCVFFKTRSSSAPGCDPR